MKNAAVFTLAIFIAMMSVYFYTEKLLKKNAALEQQLAACEALKR